MASIGFHNAIGMHQRLFIIRYNMRSLTTTIELFFKVSRYSWAFTEKLGLAWLTNSCTHTHTAQRCVVLEQFVFFLF
jgi:hypothetical protein